MVWRTEIHRKFPEQSWGILITERDDVLKMQLTFLPSSSTSYYICYGYWDSTFLHCRQLSNDIILSTWPASTPLATGWNWVTTVGNWHNCLFQFSCGDVNWTLHGAGITACPRKNAPPKYNGVVFKILMGKHQWNFYNWIYHIFVHCVQWKWKWVGFNVPLNTL